MSIFKKIRDLLKTDLLACIITDRPVDTDVPCTDEHGKDVAKIYYSGAWKEEGVAKWAFFEEKDNTLYSTVKLNEDIAKDDGEALCDSSGRNKTEEKKEVTAEKSEEIIIKEVSSEEKLIEEVVSITEMGRTRSRYQTEEESVTDGLIDQREVTGNKKKIKVFFAEDNRSFQIIIQKLLEKSDDMELLDWATDGRDAVEKIKKLDTVPDVVLMDIAMPRLDGISAIKEILAFNNSLKIVMLTAFGDKLHVQGAFDAGATGFLRKDAGLPLIREAIKQAARGGRPVHKEVAHYLKEEMN